MIYNELFSASHRRPGSKWREQAKRVTIGDLLFNHYNPGFAAMAMIMREINKLTT